VCDRLVEQRPALQTSGRARLDSVADELHDKAKLVLAQPRLDCPHDPRLAADHEPLPNFKRLLPRQMACCYQLLAATKLVYVLHDPHPDANNTHPHRL
jgi:hypothetical protein